MMFLENLDQELLLAINGANNAFLDSFFWIVSGKLTWIPFYIFILLAILRNFPKRYGLIFTLLVVASVSLADLLSAQVIKENVARYRPSHHTELSEKLHFHVNDKGEEYRGGQYGFVSNHATNFAAIAFWVFIAFGRNIFKQYV